MFELVVLSVGLVVCMGILLGLGIGITARAFEVKQDPRIELVADALPGANCGGCGLAGCNDLAKAIVAGKEDAAKCPVCSSDGILKIAEILGKEVSANAVRNIAIVLCGGDNKKAKHEVAYNGINDCKSAILVASGGKGCKFGCLGLGTCARACPFNAIEITEDGIAIVHPELCVACGKCVDVCPKNLIKIVPETVKIHVFCSSPEKGPAKMKVCKVACIGCRKCLKSAENDQIKMNGFLAQVNYDAPPPPELADASGCPTKCLRRVDVE